MRAKPAPGARAYVREPRAASPKESRGRLRPEVDTGYQQQPGKLTPTLG